MVKRWMVYLAVLLGCVILFAAYHGWMAWLLLMAVIWFPLLSLAVSLPAMLMLRLEIRCAPVTVIGGKETAQVEPVCPLPMPQYRYRLLAERTITEESVLIKEKDMLIPTEHCGQILLKLDNCRVYDYLGLFQLKVRRCAEKAVVVEPLEIPVPITTQLQQQTANAWQPKPGGGFAENHELRLYRPGDSLNQVHWKLTAKKGKLMIREAMEPRQKRFVLTLNVRGTAEQLDEKMGKLKWLGTYLTREGRNFEIRALYAEGVAVFPVANEQMLPEALHKILCMKPATEGTVLQHRIDAAWHFHIGGGTDEA